MLQVPLPQESQGLPLTSGPEKGGVPYAHPDPHLAQVISRNRCRDPRQGAGGSHAGRAAGSGVGTHPPPPAPAQPWEEGWPHPTLAAMSLQPFQLQPSSSVRNQCHPGGGRAWPGTSQLHRRKADSIRKGKCSSALRWQAPKNKLIDLKLTFSFFHPNPPRFHQGFFSTGRKSIYYLRVTRRKLDL